jgi:transcriptional regulator with XRE-family HTH domain
MGGTSGRYQLVDAEGNPPPAERVRRGWEKSQAGIGRMGNVVTAEGRAVSGEVARSGIGVTIAAAPELTPEAARRQLGEVISTARVKAGKPLLVKLAREVGYHESMLSRVLNGRVTPTRDRLENLAERLDVDTRTFTNIWVPLWTAASTKGRPKAEQAAAAAPGPPAGFECPACGSWVVNPAKHIEWHMAPNAGEQGGSVTPLRAAQ